MNPLPKATKYQTPQRAVFLSFSLQLCTPHSFSLSLSQLQICNRTSLYSLLLPICLDGGGMAVAWLWQWWHEGCVLWVQWVVGFVAWVFAGLWGGPMVVERWWHGRGSWLGSRTLNLKSSSNSLILSALGFHK